MIIVETNTMLQHEWEIWDISCKKICSLQRIKYWGSLCVWVCMWSFYIPALKRKSFLHVSFQGQSTSPNVFQKQCQYLEYPEKMHRPGENPRDHFTQHEVWVEIQTPCLFVNFLFAQELSKITMPIVLNEPLSFLQRITEYMEHTYLINRACSLSDSIERMQVR